MTCFKAVWVVLHVAGLLVAGDDEALAVALGLGHTDLGGGLPDDLGWEGVSGNDI